MSAKTQILEYAKENGGFTVSAVAETLGLSASTVRKAVKALVEEGELSRSDDNTIAVKEKITRTHTKPKIKDILAPKFADALGNTPIVIPADADPDLKRAMKAAIKTALSTVTFGNTVAEITACKDFTKFRESHLDWYKSQYLREQRAAVAAESTEAAPIAEAV